MHLDHPKLPFDWCCLRCISVFWDVKKGCFIPPCAKGHNTLPEKWTKTKAVKHLLFVLACILYFFTAFKIVGHNRSPSPSGLILILLFICMTTSSLHNKHTTNLFFAPHRWQSFSFNLTQEDTMTRCYRRIILCVDTVMMIPKWHSAKIRDSGTSSVHNNTGLISALLSGWRIILSVPHTSVLKVRGHLQGVLTGTLRFKWRKKKTNQYSANSFF